MSFTVSAMRTISTEKVTLLKVSCVLRLSILSSKSFEKAAVVQNSFLYAECDLKTSVKFDLKQHVAFVHLGTN